MPLTRVQSVKKSDRTQAEVPDQMLYKDTRCIVDILEWDNKIVNFPVEITCSQDSQVYIRNCEFTNGLIIRMEEGIDIENIFLFNSEVKKGVKVYGSSGRTYNKVVSDVTIDSCLIDKLDVIQIDASTLELYNSSVDEFLIESNNLKELVSERSEIGLLLEQSNEIHKVNIQSATFEKKKIIPKRMYCILKKRYGNKEDARDATLGTLDLLLRNTNITFPSSETSNLFYERNRVQTTALSAKAMLWMFGYFQSPMRYLITAMIWYSFIVVLLGLTSIFSATYLTVSEILRLALNAFVGLSYTLIDSNSYWPSVILSFAIGMGTVLYSGLLATMINRFRIRF